LNLGFARGETRVAATGHRLRGSLRARVFVLAALVPGLLAVGSTPAPARLTASSASSLPTFSSISAGGDHTCAVTSAGAAVCWGSNADGALGNGMTANSTIPVPVSGLESGVAAISAGGSLSGGSQSTCALTNTGAVECWGLYTAGGSSTIPVGISGLSSGVIAISVGGSHACALTSAGAVECWGSNNFGQLGDGTGMDSATPVAVSGLSSGVVAISAGDQHSCALMSSGGVKCWGRADRGQLGSPVSWGYLDWPTPVDVDGPTGDEGPIHDIVAISAGYQHSCALKSTGAVQCWGDNGYLQLGNDPGRDDTCCFSYGYSAVAVFSDFAAGTAVSAGLVSTCGITGAGAVDCWGDGHRQPVLVGGLESGIVAFSVAGIGSHACALMSTGTAKCWGANDFGQLGNGTTTGSGVAVDVIDTPTNTVSPSISGDAIDGVRLVGSLGSWNGAGSYEWTWRRCDTGCIAVGHAATYRLTSADLGSRMRLGVTAFNANGSTEKASVDTDPVQVASPLALHLPAITGTFALGSTLSASTGSWSGTGPLAYLFEWFRCLSAGRCRAIAGATSSIYVVQSADLGRRLRVRVSARNQAGLASVASATLPASSNVAPPRNTTAPDISGTPSTDHTLLARTGTWSGTPISSFNYQWRRCRTLAASSCTAIAGATAVNYRLTAADKGKRLRTTVRAINSALGNRAGSLASPVIH
jgi:alpha-tubulin suppressor-like RCC1 family protein